MTGQTTATPDAAGLADALRALARGAVKPHRDMLLLAAALVRLAAAPPPVGPSAGSAAADPADGTVEEAVKQLYEQTGKMDEEKCALLLERIRVEDERREIAARVAEYKAQLAEMNSAKQHEIEERQAKERDLAFIKGDSDARQAALERLKTQLAELEKKWEAQQRELDKLQTECQQLSRRVPQVQQEIDGLRESADGRLLEAIAAFYRARDEWDNRRAQP